jgi:hypothetical protein
MSQDDCGLWNLECAPLLVGKRHKPLPACNLTISGGSRYCTTGGGDCSGTSTQRDCPLDGTAPVQRDDTAGVANGIHQNLNHIWYLHAMVSATYANRYKTL